VKEIPLSQGYFAQIDDDDFEKVNRYKWAVKIQGKSIYAMRTEKKTIKGINKYFTFYLHRYILDIVNREIKVDHINHNGLDCRKTNLRRCSAQQNKRNIKRLKITDYTSQYKGVCFYPKNKQFMARITLNHKNICLGMFDKEKEAAEAYNKKAIELFGEFAFLNNI